MNGCQTHYGRPAHVDQLTIEAYRCGRSTVTHCFGSGARLCRRCPYHLSRKALSNQERGTTRWLSKQSLLMHLSSSDSSSTFDHYCFRQVNKVRLAFYEHTDANRHQRAEATFCDNLVVHSWTGHNAILRTLSLRHHIRNGSAARQGVVATPSSNDPCKSAN